MGTLKGQARLEEPLGKNDKEGPISKFFVACFLLPQIFNTEDLGGGRWALNLIS